jgi:hypothetical protein
VALAASATWQREQLAKLRGRSGENRFAAPIAAYAGAMAPPSHLASIRELRDIRRERPRVSGETEDHYFERLALELRRRLRAQRRRDLVVRVLRRDVRS